MESHAWPEVKVEPMDDDTLLYGGRDCNKESESVENANAMDKGELVEGCDASKGKLRRRTFSMNAKKTPGRGTAAESNRDTQPTEVWPKVKVEIDAAYDGFSGGQTEYLVKPNTSDCEEPQPHSEGKENHGHSCSLRKEPLMSGSAENQIMNESTEEQDCAGFEFHSVAAKAEHEETQTRKERNRTGQKAAKLEADFSDSAFQIKFEVEGPDSSSPSSASLEDGDLISNRHKQEGETSLERPQSFTSTGQLQRSVDASKEGIKSSAYFLSQSIREMKAAEGSENVSLVRVKEEDETSMESSRCSAETEETRRDAESSDEDDMESLPVHFESKEKAQAQTLQTSGPNSVTGNRTASLYHCGVCPETFKEPKQLAQHLKQHPPDKRCVKCGSCSKQFKHCSQLVKHSVNHTGEKLLKCKECSETFSRHQSLWVHKKIHSGESPYKCEYCSTLFNLKSNLKRHRRTHTGERPYKCKECPAAFIDSSGLKKHQYDHSESKPFKCDQCPAEFKRSHHLDGHRRTHTGEKPFKCEQCPAAFATTSNLRTHLLRHLGEKPFKCDQCTAAFIISRDLKVHKRIHSGEKPYKCALCPSVFSDTHGLRSHMKIHSDKKPFRCDQCSAEFKRSNQLKTHKMVHSGEKPYKCDLCFAAYTGMTALKQHKQRQHKVESS